MSMNIRTIETSRGDRYEVRWSVYDDDGKRHEHSKRFDTKAKAERFKHKVETNKHDDPTPSDDGKKTLSYWADQWLVHREEQMVAKRIRPSTFYGDNQIMTNTVRPMLGDRRVRSITPDEIDQFISRVQIERGVTVATAKHHYNVLRQVLAFAVRKGAIRINPADGVRRDWKPAVDHEPFQAVALSPDEVARLAHAIEQRHPDTPWALLVRFMAYTGLRAGEVAGLDVGDLRLLGTRRGEVHVRQIRVRGKGNTYASPNRPKTGKTRRVPILPKQLRIDLAAYLADHPHRDDPHAPLWPGSSTVHHAAATGRITQNTSEPDYTKAWNRDPYYKRVFRPSLHAAHLPPMRLHDLRHTAGSIMLSEGIEDWRVARYLGHSVDMLQRIYAHILETDWDADMDRFNEPTTFVSGGGDNVTDLPLRA